MIEMDTLDIGTTEIDKELKRIEKGLQRKPLDKQNKQNMTWNSMKITDKSKDFSFFTVHQ